MRIGPTLPLAASGAAIARSLALPVGVAILLPVDGRACGRTASRPRSAWLHKRKENIMNKTTETKTLPAYRIYSVSRNGEKKAIWQEIGAAWKHKDGKGLNLSFTAHPLEGAQIVLREPKAKKTGETSVRKSFHRYAELSTES
jgi:hypothetical protein